MRRVIVTTSGTSLLTSWDRMVEVKGTIPDASALLTDLRDKSLNCAEIASLSKLELDKQHDYLYFLTSDTGPGLVCATAIADYWIGQGHLYTEVVPIKGLNKNEHDFQTRGLPNLLEKLMEIKEKLAGSRMIINATGGFKAQTSYATFFGIMMGAEVVYLHEDFKSLLEFPPKPVSVDNAFILQFKEHFGEKLLKRLAEKKRDGLSTSFRRSCGAFSRRTETATAILRSAGFSSTIYLD